MYYKCIIKWTLTCTSRNIFGKSSAHVFCKSQRVKFIHDHNHTARIDKNRFTYRAIRFMYFVQSPHDFFAEFQNARVTGRRRAARDPDQRENKDERNESRPRSHFHVSQKQKFCDDDDDVMKMRRRLYPYNRARPRERASARSR